MIFKLFDLDFAENKVCKKYRKDIFKKIAGLTYSEKRKVLKKVDLEFVNVIENIDMNRPRRLDFMTHSGEIISIDRSTNYKWK